MNHVLADEMDVVIATTRHGPMMRNAQDWHGGGKGAWDYTKNRENLQQFWSGGIERMGDVEGVVTVGMRGDDDTAMPRGTQVELIQTIIRDQREIIADVTGTPAPETPHDWAVYKEVQAYYDEGTRVPEDVTILFCDDNWGNIKCLPQAADRQREGGFGIYYHYELEGGKWEHMFDQAHIGHLGWYLPAVHGFVENHGLVSFEAPHYDKAVVVDGLEWVTVPNLGRTYSSDTIAPTTVEPKTPGENAPYLEYTFSLFDPAPTEVQAYLSPT